MLQHIKPASAFEHKTWRRITCSSYFKPLPQTEQLPHLSQPYEWSELFFCSRRSNYRSKKLACWPCLHLDAFENIIEARTPYPVMIAETISSACFALLVVVFCFVIKIYTMVKSIRPSRNERVRVVYARDNQRASPVAREPTVYFPQAERGAGQHGTCNNTTYSGSQARRRQPQMHDERFRWQTKQNIPHVLVQLKIIIISFCLHCLQSFKIYIVICCLFWPDVILCSSYSWSRKFPSRIHHRQLKSTGLVTRYWVKLFS